MPSTIREKFAERLKQLREERGYSQEKLALLCNINRTYIGRIENLKRNPSLEILYKISSGLEISLSELFNFDM